MNRTLLLSFLLLMFSNVYGAEALWQYAEPGMTLAQVQKAYPSAHHVDSTDRSSDGAVELLRIDKVTIGEHDFFVAFMFKDQGLRKVFLRLTDEGDAIEIKNIFHSLLNALRSKYGKELSLTDKTSRVLEDMRASWLSGNTNIDLRYVRIGQTSPMLSITYASNSAESMHNL